jgi:hypothetical protein
MKVDVFLGSGVWETIESLEKMVMDEIHRHNRRRKRTKG